MIMIDCNMWIYYFDESLEEMKINEIENFSVTDPVPKKEDLVTGGGS